MPIFEIEISGNLYRNWSNDKVFNIIDCNFTKGDSARKFCIRTEVDGKGIDDAKKLGFNKCKDAFRLFKFCIDEQAELDYSSINVKEKRSSISTNEKSFDIDIILVKDEPLTAEQLDAINKIKTKFETEKDKRKKDMLRSIHWFEDGKLETQNKIDRFIKFWIALAVLVEGKGHIDVKIKNNLSSLYPRINNQKISTTVKYIYDQRYIIFHDGVMDSVELDKSLEQLESITIDLLRQEFGLNPKYLAKKFFI